MLTSALLPLLAWSAGAAAHSITPAQHIQRAARRCYEKALTRDGPGLTGRVTFEIEGFAGRLTSLEAHDHSDVPELVDCLCSALPRPIERTLLDSEDSGTVTVSFPFLFVPDGGTPPPPRRPNPTVTRCDLTRGSSAEEDALLPPGAVEVSAASEDGALLAYAVGEAVRARRAELERCYRQDRVRWPEQAGQATLWLSVAPTGEVTFTGMSAAELREPGTLSCMRVALDALVVTGAHGEAAVTLTLSVPPAGPAEGGGDP